MKSQAIRQKSNSVNLGALPLPRTPYCSKSLAPLQTKPNERLYGTKKTPPFLGRGRCT